SAACARLGGDVGSRAQPRRAAAATTAACRRAVWWASAALLRGRGSAAAVTSELHFGGDLGTGLRLEKRLFLETVAEKSRHQDGGEALPAGVEFLRRLIEAHALDGDAVLGALQLGLQVAES